MSRVISNRTGRWLSVLGLALLASCGNSPEGRDAEASLAALGTIGPALAAWQAGPPSAAARAQAEATLRAKLESDGQPIYSVGNPGLGYANLMARYGQNGPVETWAAMSYQTISLRDGILMATRGFGPDLMSSYAPTIDMARSGKGSFHRSYFLLDGGDQPVRFDYDCTFAPAGAETVTILGKSYATHRVNEACSDGVTHFQNVYWFDGSGKLRQSDQLMAPGLSLLHMQRVID